METSCSLIHVSASDLLVILTGIAINQIPFCIPLPLSLSDIPKSQSSLKIPCPNLKVPPAIGWVDIIEEASQFGKEMVTHGAGGHG